MSEAEVQTIADSSVANRYKAAGTVVNNVLKKIVAACVAGASVKTLCLEGEKMITEELGNTYKKDKDLTRGIAFPLSFSINHCINHFSPVPSDEDVFLKDGDMVKIDFGAHYDGHIASVAHTLVVGASASNKVTGRNADVMLAAHYCAEAALRQLKPGTVNSKITSAVTTVAQAFDCNPIDGMLSFQVKQNKIDAEKMIQQVSAGSMRKDFEKHEVNEHEVYGMDVVISTGKGSGREMDARTTIYKKTDEFYSLKLKCSREFFKIVSKDHSKMPFNLRNFEDEKKARMGVTECVAHKLLNPYPVLYEKEGEMVAQFKCTVLVMPNGPVKITGLDFDASLYESQHKLSDNKEALALVESSLKLRKKDRKKPVETVN